MNSSAEDSDGVMSSGLDIQDACVTALPLRKCARQEQSDSRLTVSNWSYYAAWLKSNSVVVSTVIGHVGEEAKTDERNIGHCPLDANTNNNTDKPKKKKSVKRRNPRQKNREDEEEALLDGSRLIIMLFVPVAICMVVVIATITSVTYYVKTSHYLDSTFHMWRTFFIICLYLVTNITGYTVVFLSGPHYMNMPECIGAHYNHLYMANLAVVNSAPDLMAGQRIEVFHPTPDYFKPSTPCWKECPNGRVGCLHLANAGVCYLPSPYAPFHDNTEDIATVMWQSGANALILLTGIIISTMILLLLYKFKFYRVIKVWLMFVSVNMLFILAYIYLEQVLRAFNVAMDFFTLFMIIWNFGVSGLFCIHWKGPLLLQQAYLIAISVLVAVTIIKFMPEWTIWALLGVLVIWDLVAVLCPKGPLKVLIETAESRNEPIFPALIYSSGMMWQITMADYEHTGEEIKQVQTKKSAKFDDELPSSSNAESHTTESHPHTSADDKGDVGDDERKHSKRDKKKDETIREVETEHADFSEAAGSDVVNDPGTGVDPAVGTHHKMKKMSKAARLSEMVKTSNFATKNAKIQVSAVMDTNEENGIKLGLGDFIFYGILVGKASSKGDWNTTLACFVAILIGLCCTLLLLAIYRTALPALPISLTFGLVFNFTTSLLVRPFMDSLASSQVYI